PIHTIEELARIRREGLDVAPLAFGVKRVENERALARPGDAGHHDQLAGRQVEIEVLEVVLARAADADRLALVLHACLLRLDRRGRRKEKGARTLQCRQKRRRKFWSGDITKDPPNPLRLYDAGGRPGAYDFSPTVRVSPRSHPLMQSSDVLEGNGTRTYAR